MARKGDDGVKSPPGQPPPGQPVVRFDGETMPGIKAMQQAESRMAEPGELIDGRYRLIAELGRGGMGIVQLAEDARLKRSVAIKFLRPGSNETDVARFRREAQLLAQLSHPNVVRVFDLGDREGLPYFIMEFLDGRTLADVLHDTHGEGLPVDVALGFGRQLCEALDVVHRQGIIHRDIKPGNVIITASMKAVLMDFGLARKELSARDRTVVSGTPQYLPPEDIRGTPLEGDDARRSDIYALGITLYELIASRPPFSDEDTSLVLHRQLLDPPPRLCDLRPDVPPAFEAVIMRALEKDPMRRQASCQELLVELARARAQTVGRTSQQFGRLTMDLARVRETMAPGASPSGPVTVIPGTMAPLSLRDIKSPPPPAVRHDVAAPVPSGPSPSTPPPGPPPVATPVPTPVPTSDPGRAGAGTVIGQGLLGLALEGFPAPFDSTTQTVRTDGPAAPVIPATEPIRVALVLNPGLPRDRLVDALRTAMPATLFEVWPAGRGGQTLRALVAFSPDCVVIDNDLIEDSPYELCAQLRSDPSAARTPLLVATEDLGAEQRRLFLRIGVTGLIGKPLYADGLALRIRQAFLGQPVNE